MQVGADEMNKYELSKHKARACWDKESERHIKLVASSRRFRFSFGDPHWVMFTANSGF